MIFADGGLAQVHDQQQASNGLKPCSIAVQIHHAGA
jgi:hypothetical protein